MEVASNSWSIPWGPSPSSFPFFPLQLAQLLLNFQAAMVFLISENSHKSLSENFLSSTLFWKTPQTIATYIFWPCCACRNPKDWTRDPCSEAWSLNQWTIRELPVIFISHNLTRLCFFMAGPQIVAHMCRTLWILNRTLIRDFPGSPVIRTPCFHCQGWGFNPWSGN